MTPQERIHYPPYTHGRIECRHCGIVLTQCRCPLACDVLYHSICAKCAEVTGPSPEQIQAFQMGLITEL